jgi:nucleotide-binding universal stress UspA family protein
MTIKTILVPLISVEISRSPLDAAIHVARTFDAHIEVLHVRPDPRTMIPYVGEGMSGALIEEIMGAAEKESGDRAVTVHELFNSAIADHHVLLANEPQPGVTASWIEDSGREDELVATLGRLVDLVVVSRPLKEAEVPTSTIFEAALFESGQALLVAPPDPVGEFGRRVMIAWNGSPEAARAVTSAMPFISRAEHVSIITASGWSEGAGSVEGLVRRLQWSGIQPDLKVATTFSGTIGEVVLEEAATNNADLIVMGAYTQSRLRQMMLGGVTRHVLSNTTIPLVMAH